MSEASAPVRTALGRIERYVLVHALVGIGATTALLSAVVLLVDFVDLTRTFGGHTDAGFMTELGLAALKSPSVVLQLLPFVFLFGVLGAFVNLNRRSELVAIRAAGMSAWRFILPAAGAAFLLGVVTIVAVNPLAATMNSAFESGREAISPDELNATRRIWLRQGDQHTQVIIGAAERSGGGDVALKNTSFFIYTLDTAGQPAFSRRIEAAQARLVKGSWRLTGALEATPGAKAVRFATLSIPSNLDDRTALERFASPQSMSFWTLPAAIGHIEAAGFSAVNYRLRLQQLLAEPLWFAAMAVLAAAFSLRLTRLGGMALLAGAGAACGFGVFFVEQLSASFAKAEIVPPFAAAWIPPILTLLSGFTLLFYTEDG